MARVRTLCLLVGILALLAGLVPAAANDEDHDAPAACEGHAPELAEDEVLVEHTYYFHSDTNAGDADTVVDFAETVLNGTWAGHMYMDEDAPTLPVPKAKTTDAAGTWNYDYAGNPFLAYWVSRPQFEAEPRIVCAEATFWAVGRATAADVQLWVDPALAETGADAQVSAAGEPDGNTTKFSANFGPVDLQPWSHLLFQVAGGAPGMEVLYDAVDFPSSLTFVTVETLEQ